MVRYKHVSVGSLRVFYREAGEPGSPVLLLLHGFPSSSHMYRDLMRDLESRFHLIAPDYPGFGYSDAPPASEFTYSFDALAEVLEGFLEALGIHRFGLYVQDYGAPLGYRIATRHPERILAFIVQNGVAHTDGWTDALAPLQDYWRQPKRNDAAVRTFLSAETTHFQYTCGTLDPSRLSPDAWMLAQALLDRPGNDRIQLDLLHDYQSNVRLYPHWQAYFRQRRPPMLIVWGKNDPLFSAAGAQAYLRDLPEAELHFFASGHFALEDHHEQIAAAICTFTQRFACFRQNRHGTTAEPI